MANTFIFDDEDQPDMGSPLPDQGDEDDQAPEEGEGNNRIFIMILIGIGFNVKMMAAFVVLPTFVLIYLLGGPNAEIPPDLLPEGFSCACTLTPVDDLSADEYRAAHFSDRRIH